jgi:phage baseplate assembly protein W
LGLDLPKFSGETREWPSFVTTYRLTTDDCQFTESENMERLHKSLERKARQCVKMVLLTNNGERVIEILRKNYGNSDVILNQLIEKVQQQ